MFHRLSISAARNIRDTVCNKRCREWMRQTAAECFWADEGCLPGQTARLRAEVRCKFCPKFPAGHEKSGCTSVQPPGFQRGPEGYNPATFGVWGGPDGDYRTAASRILPLRPVAGGRAALHLALLRPKPKRATDYRCRRASSRSRSSIVQPSCSSSTNRW